MGIFSSNSNSYGLRTAVNGARIIKSNLGKTSISRMASKSIFQYPVFVSAEIDANEVAAIAKTLERQIGAFVMTSISFNNTVDLNKYDSVLSYLAVFHNNDNINPNIMMMVKNATECNNEIPRNVLHSIAIECYNETYPESVLDTDSVNDIYKPYIFTKKRIENAISMATEGKIVDQWTLSKASYDYKAKRNKINESDKENNGSVVRGKKSSEYIFDKESGEWNTREKKGFRDGIKSPELKNSQSLSSMEPTMINVSFNVHEHGEGTWEQNVIIGIKTMCRQIRSSAVVSNMVDAIRGSNRIFDFIKYTDREVKSILALIPPVKSIKDAREFAKSKFMDDEKFMKFTQKRKMFNSAQKVLGAPIPPNVTVLITSYEVEKIRQVTGVDLNNFKQVERIMNNYYLLCFGIYDTETKELKMIFDGDSDWCVNTIYSLSQLTMKGSYMDIAQSAEMIGRR